MAKTIKALDEISKVKILGYYSYNTWLTYFINQKEFIICKNTNIMFQNTQKNFAHTKISSEKQVILSLEQALAKKDFQRLKLLSQEMYLGNNNDFRLLSVFGKMIEHTIVDQDIFIIESLLVSCRLYIDSNTKLFIKNTNNIHKPYV
ncbi:MAG: hypothetical protein IPK14_24045 [Blastocatellia bacterium]|nr:hypothetical protein [Blastocatellia bacterium]MBL8195825.1 hypothetical protein [Blastocatellia bacterium]MBN8725451.1 hypothetical protein [Acidobacteriota bacterium]